MDWQEYTDTPDAALFDGTTTLGGSFSDGDTLTTFGEILRHEREREDEERNEQSRRATSEVVSETQALCTQARANVGECLVDTSADVSVYMKIAGDKIKDYLDDFFSEEQQVARAETAKVLVSNLRSGITSCHDNMDSMLEHLFEHPLREVEIRPDNLEPNESITIDAMTDGETTIESYTPRSQWFTYRGRKQATSSQEYEDSVFLAPTEEEPFTSCSETDWEGRDEPESGTSNFRTGRGLDDARHDEAFPAIHATDTEDSVLRFKEALYRHLGETSEPKPFTTRTDRYKHDPTKIARHRKVGKDSVVLDDRKGRDIIAIGGDECIDVSEEPAGEAPLIAYPSYTTADTPAKFDPSRTSSSVVQNQIDETDSQATEMVSGSKPAQVDSDAEHINMLFAASSMPDFDDEPETIDCSLLEEHADGGEVLSAYGDGYGESIQPIDLTMFQ